MGWWVRRAGLHLLAAVGATGVFAAAAAAGAYQAAPPVARPPVQLQAPTPSQSQAGQSQARSQSQGQGQGQGQAGQGARAARILAERSVAGTVREMRPEGLVVDTLRGQELQVQPAPGALIRLNGKTLPLEGLQTGDRVVILGQAQPRGRVFLAHAITARRAR